MTTPDTNNTVENTKTIHGLIVANMTEEPKTDESKLIKADLDEQQPDEHESGEAELKKTNVHDTPEEKAPAEIYDDSSLAEITLSVLSDNQKSIDDVKMETKVISLINELRNKEICDLDKPSVALSNLQSLYKIYDEKTSRTEKINSGISTRHGILKGMILNAEKKLRRIKGKQWVAHHKETYGEKSLRSSQHYMALAKIPNILNYSAIGKERLTKALRATKTLKITGDDPIAKLLEECEVQFDPSAPFEENMKIMRFGLDYAVAKAKIKKAEEKGVELGLDLDLIRSMINAGHSVSSHLIADLFKIKSESRDVNAHIKSFFDKDSNKDEMLPHIRRAESFPNLVEGLKSTVESIRAHRTLADRIKPDHVREVETHIADLKGLIENTGSVSE